jgi:CPA2 family monovalent cation:H+ antiporter-2
MVVKLVLFLPLGRLFGLSWPAAFESGLLLAPCGEFAFVIIGIATTVGILDRTIAATLTAIVSMTMLTIPLFGMLGRQFTRAIERRRKSAPPELPPEGVTGHAIVAGHGRVGQVVVEMLERHGVPYLAVDRSQATVSAARRDRRQVYYGDIKIPGFLEACGIREAKAVIVTVSDPVEIDEIVASVRAMRPDIVIVSRARDAGHASHLYALGVTDAVPETIEASLQLSEASLVGIGKQTGPVIASIHEKRDEFRRMLQAASGDEQRRLHAVRQRTRQSE